MNSEQPSFPVAHCKKCESAVIVARDAGAEATCVRCGEATLDSSEKPRWVGVEELFSLGFTIGGMRDPRSTPESGCRGGQCGITQPD